MATAYKFSFLSATVMAGVLGRNTVWTDGMQPPELPFLNSQHPMTVITNGIHGLRSLRSSK